MSLLPFFRREANILIKIYPRRVIFELPKIDNIIASKLKVMEINGSIYVLGHLEDSLKREVCGSLTEHQNGIVNITDVESPVARDRATSNDTARGGT